MTAAGKPPDRSGGKTRSESRFSPVASIQSPTNRTWFCKTTGPSSRNIMSTQGANLGFILNSGSAELRLPQYVTRPSTTVIFRWLRRSSRLVRTVRIGLFSGNATASCTPAFSILRQSAELTRARDPRPSAMARHVTPLDVARINASASAVPVSSSSQM